MLVDGRAMAEAVLAEVAAAVAVLPVPPTLTALTASPDLPTQRYLALKQHRAAAAGIPMRVLELPANSSTEAAIAAVRQVLPHTTGLVVQLPLPAPIDTEAVLAAVPPAQDPDGFAYGKDPAACLPPVVAAIAHIARQHAISWADRAVVVIGEGRLVGGPAAIFARRAGARVTVLNVDTFDPQVIKAADIVISGAGQPRLITPDMISPGAAVFDAGTSEAEGELVGDVDPAVAAVAGLLTPVPGGIGPLTIACLLRNLHTLQRQ